MYLTLHFIGVYNTCVQCVVFSVSLCSSSDSDMINARFIMQYQI